ncbi:hypothetical protein BKP45_13715 [Anaerobacillus alkalidiazotrophicus]|uniref:DUF3600 domain-containing protein n=1 Tax=Anaerobacillus alkalidiazotrophicus TaxID=472963 RepID=A0A1S2M372_9BACI|nr:DUF3600 domain-containing protein [Anaerobacillus alkalidiazotrophicus]OIJ19212.1 hypothetical protein BKP45_13715 [Anaerobacillus alkalidiazotrophicus]
MNFEKTVKQSLIEKSKEVNPPQKLKQKVLNKIEMNSGLNKIKKRIVAGLIVIFLIIPTSAIAYQAYLADELYGSFENVKNHFASATIDSYMLLNAKLLQVKGELGKEEFQQFKDHLKIITGVKIDYGNQYGNIDFDLLPQDKVEEIKNAMMVVQPYFDRLNGHESSNDMLSAEEYELYIEALMTYEKILVQSGINPSKSFENTDVKPELLDQFLNARGIIKDVDNKIMTIASDSPFPIPNFSINNQNIEVDYVVLTYLGSDIHGNDSNDSEILLELAERLQPIGVTPSAIMEVTFDEQPQTIEFQIMNMQRNIYSKGSLEELQLPTEKGDYLIVLLGEWGDEKASYSFIAKVID